MVLRQLISSEEGVSAIEYALLGALIALVIVGALTATGHGNGGLWARWTNTFLEAIGVGGS
ncbi:MAG: Flp family type IVb pilin [Betaproteobacteria bacterium HGW-Betaproteobacteria-9]|nr:MAG: Flp family type IVb pilin [Betaproteobacteria bacterium HGW-Betaproteobacteria-9]